MTALHPSTEEQTPVGIRLGLRANVAQFSLLVGVNALVGGMLGQERTVLPLLATEVFHLTAYTAALTYNLVFGLTKAPGEPGWYTIVVETEDSRLATYSAQGRKWATAAFKVEGGRYLSEQHVVYGKRIPVPTPRGILVQASLPASAAKSGPIPVEVVSYDAEGTELGSATVTLEYRGEDTTHQGVFQSAVNQLQLYPSSMLPAPGYPASLPVQNGGKLVAKLTAKLVTSDIVIAWIDTSPVDLDVDSDNDAGTALPQRDAAEDDAEDFPPLSPTGKIVFVNHNDDNRNGVPDFADLSNTDEGTFVPVVLTIEAGVPMAQVSVTIAYDGLTTLPSTAGVPMTDPRDGHQGQPTDFVDYRDVRSPPDGGGGRLTPALRLWDVTTPGAPRTPGKYLQPGAIYTAAGLGFIDSVHERVLYLEPGS